jgi:hypothetical protein
LGFPTTIFDFIPSVNSARFLSEPGIGNHPIDTARPSAQKEERIAGRLNLRYAQSRLICIG